ncbi:hypothetical protein PG996_001805 [Apiospora saccharicola]|uniref:DUF7905 domain-containing protein n=1 Tax=Apiospora saccharicola TaxID=335842 RepID=A0ABR1WHN6_9PEZI
MDDLIDFGGDPIIAKLSILDEPCPDITAGGSTACVENHPPTEKVVAVEVVAGHPQDADALPIRIQPPSTGPSITLGVDVPKPLGADVPEPLLLHTRPARRPAPSKPPCRQPVGDIWGTCIQKQWAYGRAGGLQHRGDPEQSEITVSRYLISHDPELAKGVLEGVAKDLDHTDSKVEVLGNNRVKFLQIQDPSPEINVQRLKMARILTDEFISDKTVTTRATFVEPSECPLSGFEVFLDSETQESKGLGVRPIIRPCDNIMDSQPTDCIDEDPLYSGNFCQQLSVILKRVGSLNSGYNLNVVFGRYIVTTYPKAKNKYDINGFRKLMGQSRCQGKLVTHLGGPNDAIRILNALKREDGVFEPPGVNTRSLDDIKPTFTFDVYSAQHIFTSQLVCEGDDSVLSMKKLQCLPLQDEDSTEFCYNTLCLGRNFDWKIQLMNEVPALDESYQSLKTYLTAARVTLPSTPPGSDPDLAMFPHVRLSLGGNEPDRVLMNNIRKTAISSIYSFRYGLTDYMLEFTIRREWDSVRDMTLRQNPSSITYSINLKGEHWGDYKGNRATDFTGSGRGWGPELEHLLPNNPGQDATAGNKRVEALLYMIKEIHKILVVA